MLIAFLAILTLLNNSPIGAAELIRVAVLGNIFRDAPAGTEILLEGYTGLNAGGETIRAPRVRLVRAERWIGEAGTPYERGDFSIMGTELIVRLPGGEIRRYPLPARLILDTKGPRLIVTSSVPDYAADSARAEYGSVASDAAEALTALRLVILARARLALRRSGPAAEYDISDTTAAQVYTGLTDYRPTAPDWEIDETNLRGELLFHAESGGVTMPQSVFSGVKGGFPPVRDEVPFLGLVMGTEDTWTRTIDNADILRAFGMRGGEADVRRLMADTPKERFRTVINRRYGWNTIRSNNYTASFAGGAVLFTGRGMGHGCGLSQRGALILARHGFSRYEILHHYYRGIRFRRINPAAPGTNVSWVVFSLSTGEVLNASHGRITEHRLPPGSLAKLLATMTMLSIDPTIAASRHNCAPASGDYCWKDHGMMDLESALANSCNRYFHSLSGRAAYSAYAAAAKRIAENGGFRSWLPARASDAQYRKLLSGLDFSVGARVADLTRLVIHFRNTQPGLCAGLQRTFTEGTAAPPIQAKGDPQNLDIPTATVRAHRPGIWGKTSSMLYGSNDTLGYGMFAGGRGDTGIIVILRHGTGQIAAQWARYILALHEESGLR
jgi:hypothetical protein